MVQVEKIGEIDAPAVVVAQKRLRGISHRPGEAFVYRTEMLLDAAESGMSYDVTAHIDLDHDGSVGRGDWITMQSYPLSLVQHEEVTLCLKEVN